MRRAETLLYHESLSFFKFFSFTPIPVLHGPVVADNSAPHFSFLFLFLLGGHGSYKTARFFETGLLPITTLSAYK
jgi:hypothetical protein